MILILRPLEGGGLLIMGLHYHDLGILTGYLLLGGGGVM